MNVKLTHSSSVELNRAIQRLMDLSNKTVFDVLKQQGRLLCVDFARITRPLGATAQTGRDHKERIKAKIEDVYWTVGKTVEVLRKEKGDEYAKGLQRMIRQKKYTEAGAMLTRVLGDSRWRVGDFDNGKLHKQQAFRKRIHERLVVLEKGSLTKYRMQKQKLAGFAKSGFANAAKHLGGTRGIPGFASKQRGPGRGQVRKSKKGVTLTIENRVKHINIAFDKKQEQMAINNRAESAKKLIQRIAKNKMRKASRSIK